MTTATPARAQTHEEAKADYRVDQIRRYMRRHQGTAMFINGPTQKSLTLNELSGLTRGEIKKSFNTARLEGHNQ